MLELRALEGTAFEVVLGRRRLGQERLDGRELRLVGEVRGRGDRQVAVVQVLTRACEGLRLDRLRGRAHEGDEAGIAGRGHDLAVLDRNGVHAVHRLDGLATLRGYPDRLSHEEESLVPHPAIHAGPWPAITRRQSARDPGARRHYRKGH